MNGLKESVAVADVAQMGHSRAVEPAGTQAREDITEHVFGDDHVVIAWLPPRKAWIA